MHAHSDHLRTPTSTFRDDPITIAFASDSTNMHINIEATNENLTPVGFDWICRQNIYTKMTVNLSNTTNLIQHFGRHVLFLDFCELNGEFSLIYSTDVNHVDIEVPSTQTSEIMYQSSAAEQGKLAIIYCLHSCMTFFITIIYRYAAHTSAATGDGTSPSHLQHCLFPILVISVKSYPYNAYIQHNYNMRSLQNK